MKKLVTVSLLLLSFFSLFSLQVLADATQPTMDENRRALDAYREEGKVSSPVSKHEGLGSWGWAVVGNMGYAEALSSNPEVIQNAYRNSLMGQTTRAIASLYQNRPAGIDTFAYYYGQKMGIVKPAYAQGIGFSGLSPLLPLWRAFRNVAYAFLILVMVIIGFMILFRMKIDPRTVVSVQNALPRIVVTLILITFSYAIVGLMIDLMYLLIFLAIATLKAAIPNYFQGFTEAVTLYTGGTFGHLAGAMLATGVNSVESLVQILFGGFGNLAVIGAALGAIIGLATDGIGEGIRFGILGGGGALFLPYLIVMIALLFAIFRLFILLVSAYIQIILALIFGPLFLMFGAIPNNDAFGSWFRGLIANMAVFPIASIMLLIGMILTSYGSTTNLWTPPGLTGNTIGTGTAGGPGANLQTGITGLIGFAILFVIPNIADSVKEMLKAKPAIPVGAGTIFQPIISTATTGMNLGYQYAMISSMTRKPPKLIETPKESGGGGGGH